METAIGPAKLKLIFDHINKGKLQETVLREVLCAIYKSNLIFSDGWRCLFPHKLDIQEISTFFETKAGFGLLKSVVDTTITKKVLLTAQFEYKPPMELNVGRATRSRAKQRLMFVPSFDLNEYQLKKEAGDVLFSFTDRKPRKMRDLRK